MTGHRARVRWWCFLTISGRRNLRALRDVVGRKVLVNQHPMTVIGVAAATFRGIDVGEVPSLWIPAAMSAQAIPGFNGQLDRRTRWMQILGRLRPDVTLAQAQAGLQPWFKAMLDEDTRRAGFPRITAERRQRFLASTLVAHSGAAGPFQSAAQDVPAAMGLIRGDGRVVGSGLFECRRPPAGARLGPRTRDQYAVGTGRVARTDRPATSRR